MIKAIRMGDLITLDEQGTFRVAAEPVQRDGGCDIEVTPVKVINAGEWQCRTTEFTDWVAEQGIKPTRCYKVVLEDTHATFYCYGEDAEGRKYVVKTKGDPQYGEAARITPQRVELTREAPLA